MARCKRCGGAGDTFILKRGNPFAMRIEVLARAMVKVKCFDCNGTGQAKPYEAPSVTSTGRDTP